METATTIVASPYSICLSKEAVRLVATYLPTAIAQPGNLTARYWLMYASAIAGMSFDLSFLHITHSMEHAMSAINEKVTRGDGLVYCFRPCSGKFIMPYRKYSRRRLCANRARSGRRAGRGRFLC